VPSDSIKDGVIIHVMFVDEAICSGDSGLIGGRSDCGNGEGDWDAGADGVEKGDACCCCGGDALKFKFRAMAYSVKSKFVSKITKVATSSSPIIKTILFFNGRVGIL
jgi:hypothetical protein